MSQVGHGGGVDQATHELGLLRDQILDFSASINPLGLPESVRVAIDQAIGRITDYPEIDAQSLRKDLARYHELPEANLLPGSGSTELIYLLPRVLKPKRTLIVEPAFSEYAPALIQAGCQIDSLALRAEDNFHFSLQQVLDALQPDTEMVWLANPGNPSGLIIDPQQLRTLIEGLGNCRLVVDEAFIDFSPEHSLIGAVTEFDNLFILRSLTKFYAIPGLRVGYLAGPARELLQLAAERQPWTLSNLAIAAGKACLEDTSYQRRTLKEIPRLRDQLAQGLEALSVMVYPSAVNYLLFRIPDTWPDAQVLCDRLRGKGILIRNCDNFSSLNNRYLRVAVRREDENRQLLSVFKEIADV